MVQGGVYATAVESAAGLGASLAARDRGQFAVGVHNATDFLRPATSGRAEVIAEPLPAGPCPATMACHHHRRTRQRARTRPAQAAERPASPHRHKLTSGPPPGGSTPGSAACSVQAAAGCDSAAPGCPRTDSARDIVFHLRPTGCGQARREGRAQRGLDMGGCPPGRRGRRRRTERTLCAFTSHGARASDGFSRRGELVLLPSRKVNIRPAPEPRDRCRTMPALCACGLRCS